MLFFSKFNKNKKDEIEELNEKIKELEATVNRKSKEISDLINEIEKTNRTIQFESVTQKQIEIFEKNLKDIKDENLRLKDENLTLKNELISKADCENTKITNNSEELEKIKTKNIELKNIIRDKDEKIYKLSNKLEKLENTAHYNDVTQKQIELFEKNFKEVRDENSKIKLFLQEYKLSYRKEKIEYNIPVEFFYSSTKFKSFVEYLMEKKIRFVQELSFGKFDTFDDSIKSMEEARQKWENYNSYKIIDWDIITYLKRGERVNKIYSRNRKFVTFLNDNGIEFMDDLEKFEFENLKKIGFDSKSIEELKERKEEYYKEYRTIK